MVLAGPMGAVENSPPTAMAMSRLMSAGRGSAARQHHRHGRLETRRRPWHPAVVAFAQRMVTTVAFTLPGVVLTLVGAHGMGWLGGFSLWQPGWLAWGHSLFIVSGVIWLGVLVPTQVQQGRLAASFATSPAIPARYWQLNRRWIVWGVAATVLPVINMGLMILKPQ
jgi:uncharacterized membrane protein